MTSEQVERSDASTSREGRLNLRTTAKQDALIRLAARTTSKTVTDFVLDSASNAAEQVLADRRWFMIDEDSWANFNDLLERPAVLKPRLRDLLAEAPEVFEVP